MTEHAETLNDQGIKLAKEGLFKEAIACISRAITLEKDNYLLWFNLGVTERDSGNLSEARKALEKAYELCEEDEDVVENLALVCLDAGNVDDAMSFCVKGLNYNPQNPHLFNTMGVCWFTENQFPDAADSFEVAVMLNPYYYDALYNLRDTYHELGNETGAAECEKRMDEIKKSRRGDLD